MLGRRTLLQGLAGILLAAPRGVAAQPARRTYRVGVLRPASTDARFQRDFGGFRDALREGGYAEGVNLALEYRMRPGPGDAILGMASELVRLPVDVIAAISPAAVVAAAKATRTIPIVAVDLESDPLATGLVTSLARPGGNVTGLFLDFPELAGKWLELIREAVPGLTRVAVLWDPATGSAQVKAAEAAARTLRLQIQPLQARAAADLEAAVQRASAGSCYERYGEYTRAVTLLRAALSTPLRDEFRARVEQSLARCLAQAHKALTKAAARRRRKQSPAAS